MGCARWWWNYALNLCNETYKETGKGLTQIALNKVLPKLKKSASTAWLGECYSQVLQSTTLNLTKAFKNFFEKRKQSLMSVGECLSTFLTISFSKKVAS